MNTDLLLEALREVSRWRARDKILVEEISAIMQRRCYPHDWAVRERDRSKLDAKQYCLSCNKEKDVMPHAL